MRLLPQREPVVVARRKVADVERDHREARDLHGLPLREEALRDAPLIEHLDRARMQPARARAGELLRARRSTMATSTRASASSAASISPVGPPPAITTACSSWPTTVRHDPGLAAIPRVWHKLVVERGGGRAALLVSAADSAIAMGPPPLQAVGRRGGIEDPRLGRRVERAPPATAEEVRDEARGGVAAPHVERERHDLVLVADVELNRVLRLLSSPRWNRRSRPRGRPPGSDG